VRGEIRSVDDPLLRALLLDALWEEVRDAQLAPLDYIDLALDQLPRETDEITVSSLLDGAQTAFRRYLSDAQRAAVAARIEACLREGLLHAPELGARIAHFRAYTAAAVTAEARADLHLLIAGKLDVPGMALASRERFRIVERLLALGDPGADRLLAAQAAADASDDGHRYAYAAGAARADPAAKQRYFAAYVRDTRLAEGWIAESLVAFNTVEHAALTLPYLRRALVALSRLQRERKIFFVNHWLTAFLDGQTTAAALATVKSFLRGAKLAPDLRRKVLEAMDGLARTVRIRARYGA
jgi:aminopeptidase N